MRKKFIKDIFYFIFFLPHQLSNSDSHKPKDEKLGLYLIKGGPFTHQCKLVKGNKYGKLTCQLSSSKNKSW